MPVDKGARHAVEVGRQNFASVGCASCHVPELRLDVPVFTEPNPYNPPGNLHPSDVSSLFSVHLIKEGPEPHLTREPDGSVLVPIFSDLKRHKMGTTLDNEKLVQAGIPTDEWLTRKLWGMSSEPPFLHHGRATLISEAILMHGGEAREAREAFSALSPEGQQAIVEFLKTLRVLPEQSTTLISEPDETPTTSFGIENNFLIAIMGVLGGGVIASVIWIARGRKPTS